MSENVVKQCKSCPWRIDCVPDRDIWSSATDQWWEWGACLSGTSGLAFSGGALGANTVAMRYAERALRQLLRDAEPPWFPMPEGVSQP